MPLREIDARGLFARLDAATRSRIESRTHQLRVRKGQIVVGHGGEGGDVYCVLEGAFDVMLHSPHGREVYLRKILPGGLFGEYAALDGGPRSATIVAATGGLLAVIGRKDFVECLKANPEAAVWVAGQLTVLIREMTERIFELSALNVRSRLHCELMRLSFIAGVAQNRAVIDPSPTHAELANRIGTHREAVTRELNELAHMNLLSQKQRHLEILDVARLSQMVERTGGNVTSAAGEPATGS